MNRALNLAAIAVAFAQIAWMDSSGFQKAKTPPKPAQGAVQMPGDNGKLGVPYQLGAKNDEFVFTLEKAEFASRVSLADGIAVPDDDKRLLILTYAVQNPSKVDRFFFNQSFSFTVVSPDDENFLCDGVASNGWLAYHPDRRDRLSMQVKPAQKVRAITAIEMHMKGPVNKLIVQRGKGTPVLRYDLREKVVPLKGAHAANGGLDMLEIGETTIGQPLDLGNWDIVVEKVEEVAGPIGDWEPNAGKFVVLTLSITNVAKVAYPLHSSMLTGKMTDEDGGDVPFANVLAKNSSAEPFNNAVEAGATVRVRHLYHGSSAKPAKVVFRDAATGRFGAVKLQ